jgi:glycosyltransferase involved in cell wall biosynthesis
VIRIVRVIARLNIGGPAIQAITLTRRLEDRDYETHLVRGREGADEGSMDYLAEQLGVKPTLLPTMHREPGSGDLQALRTLIGILRRERPQIVHTHAAKAGTLGRTAAIMAFPRRARRPLVVHTFHGHSLTGYFSSRTAGVFRRIEQILAARTDILIAVSPEVRDDLVALRVAGPERFVVVPLGFDLTHFIDDVDRASRRAALRREWGLTDEDEVVTLVARLAPIKRVDRFLRVAARLADRPGVRFVVVGDGELREALHSSPEARALDRRLVWAGFRRDMADVCFASDVIVLTSDNEGTPVSLIEAQAAAAPVVSTDVGGVRSAVLHGETGLLAAPEDEAGLAHSVASILDDPLLAARMAAAGREHASSRFRIERLVDDHARLYRRLLNQRELRRRRTGPAA